MTRHCMNYSTTGEQCIYVTGHREEHRFAEPGEGDLSDAIRLRVAIDVREDEIEQLITERDALRTALEQTQADRHRDLETIVSHEAFMREQQHQIEKRDVKLAMSMDAIRDESTTVDALRAALAEALEWAREHTGSDDARWKQGGACERVLMFTCIGDRVRADRLAELAKLVPTDTKPDLDPDRCAVCGWPLAHQPEGGCVRGNCSERPRPKQLYDAERAAKETK